MKSKQNPSNNAFHFDKEESKANVDNRLKISSKSVFGAALFTFALLPLLCHSPHMNGQFEANLGQKHSSVVGALLIISGVEQNPGPAAPAEVFGNIIKAATNDDVKKTLNKFKTDADHKTNVKAFNKPAITVENLKMTLRYLNDNENDLAGYLKEGLCELVVKRIEQLLPDTCNTCGQGYAIDRVENPAIKCILCSKGCCQPCGEKYVDNLKSIGLSNVFWFCSTCNQRRAEEALQSHDKLLKVADKTKAAANDKQSDTGEGITKPNEESVIAVSDDDDKEATKPDEVKKGEKKEEEKKEEVKKTKKETNCKFFQQNRCKFGASGKGCNYLHQKICQRFIKNGSDGRLGCSGCDKFHPKLCRNSKSTKKCFTQNCRFVHLKGTKRHPERAETSKKEVRNKTEKKPTESNDFLGMKQELDQLKKILHGWNGSGHLQTNQMMQPTTPPIMNPMMTQPMHLMNIYPHLLNQGVPMMNPTNLTTGMQTMNQMFHPLMMKQN